MSDYIETTDIRDVLYANEVTAGDITDSTNFYNDFATSRGVDSGDISTPVHYQAKEMLVYFVQMRMAENRIGIKPSIPVRSNGTQIIDVHQQKFERYKKAFEEARSRVTAAMITGDADTSQEYHGTNFSVYRA